MKTLQAHVRGGRLVLDEPTALPEGTVLDLTVADAGDELDEAEQASLDAALQRSWDQASSGQRRPVAELLGRLRAAR